MEIFPQTILPDYPVTVESVHRTLVTGFDSGREQRRKKWAFPKRRLKLPFKNITGSEMDLLWEFYSERYGDYESFYYLLPWQQKWFVEYLGRGTGAQTIFDLRSLSTVGGSVTTYVNGTPTAKTVLTGGGDGGSDRVQFSPAPAAGSLITADFQGKLRLTCRFAVGSLSYEAFSIYVFQSEVELLEVR
jgi:hypothetical protein